MSSPPSPTRISKSTFQSALSLYPSLVAKVYASKLKGDAKKVAEAVDRDRWRFEVLEGDVKQRKGKTKGFMKVEVERLVQWKITHGHSRPFLPGMVRKNEASAIETQTSLAFAALASASTSTSTPPSLVTVTTALDIVCKLNGIGPATGTLILNIFDPDHIPFFQDEMYVWFFPDSKGEKLKYSVKEYRGLFEGVEPVLKRLGCSAVELEKVAYVLGHMKVLEDGEREELEISFGKDGVEGNGEEDDDEGAQGQGDGEDGKNEKITSRNGTAPKTSAKTKAGVKTDTQKEPTTAKKGRKRVIKDEEITEGAPAEKRRSQRTR